MCSSQKIAFISGRSGVGKTTTVVNIAHHLANLGNSVCIIDMDMFLGELHITMGMEQFYDNKKTLYHVLKNIHDVEDCLLCNDKNPNISLLPSSRVLNLNNIDMSNLKDILDYLSSKFEYILMDIPADFGNNSFLNLDYSSIDKIVFVSSHTVSSITNTDSLLNYFELNNPFPNLSLIITNYLNELDIDDNNLALNNIHETLNIPILGVVSYDKDTAVNLNIGNFEFFNKKSNIFKEYEAITNNLIETTDIDMSIKKRKSSRKFLPNTLFKKNNKKYIN